MLLMLLSFFSQTAQAFPADMAVECPPPHVEFASPSVGQTGVPIDVVPIVGLSNDECYAYTEFDLALRTGDLEILTERVSVGDGDLLSFSAAPQLEPNSEYTLSASSVGYGETTEISFTTSDQTVAGFEGVPSGQISDVALKLEGNEPGAFLQASHQLNPITDPDDLSLLFVYDEQNPSQIQEVLRVGVVDMDDLMAFVWRAAPFPEEVCLSVSQRDGTGTLSERSAPFCGEVEVTKTGGCSVTSALGLSASTTLLALAAIRRRRKSLS